VEYQVYEETDLAGNDLKLVRYSILFTKPDAETVLQGDREEVLDYATNGGSFGALKVAAFLGDLQKDGIPWPAGWKQRPGEGYQEPGQPLRDIPVADRKYIVIVFEVVSRQPKEQREADDARVEALREIRDRL
jgi:hypothetical protein